MLLPSRFYNLISSPNLNGVKFHIILSTRSSIVLTFGRQLSGAPSSLFHCVCVSHHLSPHLCCLPHLIPLPLAVTLISHPKLLPLTHCASYCVTVYPLHQPSVTSILLCILRLGYLHPLFRLTVYPSAQPSSPPLP